MVVREDAQQLYGFSDAQEKTIFRTLLKVNGVGPKMALGILSTLSVELLVHTIEHDDINTLVKVPGVGKKTAERLMIELRDRFKTLAQGTSTVATMPQIQFAANSPVAEAEAALQSLGYKPLEAQKAVAAVKADYTESADIIRAALKREQMEIFIGAARGRGEALDHTLIFGPPGLGKTTLANIIAREMGGNLKSTSGPVLERAGDLAAMLTNLEEGDVLFIDEIHRLSPVIEEILYPAMEDYQLDIMIGEGPAARSIKLDLPPFTLVAATTRAGLLTSPLRDRFGIVQRLEFYSVEDLTHIVSRSANLMDVPITVEGAEEVARRSRGTPRIANRLLRRVRDYAQVKGTGEVTHEMAQRALDMLNVDKAGLDTLDRRYLSMLLERFDGGPAGVEALAAAMAEDSGTLEDVIEPYLIQQGYVMRTARGRIATNQSYLQFGMTPPEPKN